MGNHGKSLAEHLAAKYWRFLVRIIFMQLPGPSLGGSRHTRRDLFFFSLVVLQFVCPSMYRFFTTQGQLLVILFAVHFVVVPHARALVSLCASTSSLSSCSCWQVAHA